MSRSPCSKISDYLRRCRTAILRKPKQQRALPTLYDCKNELYRAKKIMDAISNSLIITGETHYKEIEATELDWELLEKSMKKTLETTIEVVQAITLELTELEDDYIVFHDTLMKYREITKRKKHFYGNTEDYTTVADEKI